MSEGHGGWTFNMRKGVPLLQFHILADLYTQSPKGPNGPLETTYDGSVAVDASVPVASSDAVQGLATLTFPDGHPCAKQFNGPVAFVATPLTAEPPPSPKK